MKATSIYWAALVLVGIFLCGCSSTGIQVDTGEVLPPGILPVVMIQGSDYEMGYHYGQQAGRYILRNKESTWAGALETLSRAEVMEALKANQTFVKEYTPELIDQMKGMADGATAAGYEISYTDIMLLNCTLPNPETSHYPAGAEQDALPPKKCSVSSAWGSTTTDGRLIGMDTLDSGESLFGVIIVAFPDKGNNYICGAQAGEIGDHFLMNNKGFFLGNSGGGGSPRPEDNDYGICWSCSLPYIVRFADNAVEARDMIMGWQINVPENFHFVDVQGNAFVVEKTAAIQSVRKPGDFGEWDFMYSTNTYLNEAMAVTKTSGFVKEHGGYGAYASPRNMMLWDMLNNYHGHVDVEFMKMMLRFPGEGPPYPPAGGWDAKICRPSNGWVSVPVPDDGDEGIVNICTGPAGRVIHSSKAHDGSTMRTNYPFVGGTHTFYQLQLAGSPKEVAQAAKRTAKDNIATAYAEFMKLKLTDEGYGALNDIYSLANAEYYQGSDYLDKGRLATGNESIKYFAQAATALTQAQAHAMQVYEALVPPPCSPSDLGLRPFGGDWAEWETNLGVMK